MYLKIFPFLLLALIAYYLFMIVTDLQRAKAEESLHDSDNDVDIPIDEDVESFTSTEVKREGKRPNTVIAQVKNEIVEPLVEDDPKSEIKHELEYRGGFDFVDFIEQARIFAEDENSDFGQFICSLR